MVHPDDPRGPSKLPTYITSPKPKQKTLERAVEVIQALGFPERVPTSELYDAFSVQDAPRMLYFLGYTPSVTRGQRGMRLWDAPPELDARYKDQVVEEPVVEEPITVTTMTGEKIELDDRPVIEIDYEAFEEPIEEVDEEIAEVEPYVNPVSSIEETADAEWLEEHTTVNTDPVVDDQFEAAASQDRGDPDARIVLDSEDSWSVPVDELLGKHLSRMVQERLEVLRVVGLEYEFRVWRKK